MPFILKENRQLAHRLDVNWTVYQLLEETALFDVQRRSFDALKVVLKALEHGVVDFFEVFVILLTEHIRNRIGNDGSIVDFSCQFLVVPALVLHLESLPDFEWEDHLKRLAMIAIVNLKRSAFSKR